MQYLLSFIGMSGAFCVRNHGSDKKLICGKLCNSSDNYTLKCLVLSMIIRIKQFTDTTNIINLILG